MYSFHYDDVQYTLDDGGDYKLYSDDAYMKECVDHLYMVIERHHSIIKEVYNFIKQSYSTEIWAVIGSGLQLNVVFGNKNGYIGALLLDWVSPQAIDDITAEIKKLFAGQDIMPEFVMDQSFVILPYSLSDDKHFEHMNIEGVEVQLFKDTDYFDDDEEDDDDE